MTVKEFKIQCALGTLSEDDRWQLAFDKHTAKGILAIIAKDHAWRIRRFVAHNANTSFKVLMALAKDEDVDVKIGVANNHSTPLKVLKVLAKDNDPYVKYHIASHPNVSIGILRLLATDIHHSLVRKEAQAQLDYYLDKQYVINI